MVNFTRYLADIIRYFMSQGFRKTGTETTKTWGRTRTEWGWNTRRLCWETREYTRTGSERSKGPWSPRAEILSELFWHCYQEIFDRKQRWRLCCWNGRHGGRLRRTSRRSTEWVDRAWDGLRLRGLWRCRLFARFCRRKTLRNKVSLFRGESFCFLSLLLTWLVEFQFISW